MSGRYIFRVPMSNDKIYTDKGTRYGHYAPYRLTGVQRVEWEALKLRKMLILTFSFSIHCFYFFGKFNSFIAIFNSFVKVVEPLVFI